MLSTYKSPTNLEIYINNAFKVFKNNIVINFLGQVKDEQLKGASCKQYNFSFYLALYLVTLVYKETLKYPLKEWNYFIVKYKLDIYKKCLSCDGINLNDILIAFNLPPIVATSGINDLQVEETLQVEPTDLTITTSIINTIDVLTTLNSKECTSDFTLRPPITSGEEIPPPPSEP